MVRCPSRSRPSGSKVSTNIVARGSVAITISCLLLSGCLRLLGQDFDKATLVGELELGSSDVFKRSLTLHPGNAELILAVPNYRCAPLPDAKITFAVRSSKGVEFFERRSLSELTWSYGRDSCDAYGYLRGDIGEGRDKPKGSGMRFQVPHDSIPITIEIDSSQISGATGRVALVWFIYGGRVPGAKIFGNFAERTPGSAK